MAAQRDGKFWSDRATAHASSAVPLPFREPSEHHAPDDVPLVLSQKITFVEMPCLDSEFVRLNTAVQHPALENPVAYVGNFEIAPLLRQMLPGMTAQEVALNWSPAIPLSAARDIARWLIGRGILVQQSAAESDRRSAA